MKNWLHDDIQRLDEQAAKALPAEAVAPFVEEVRMEALTDRYLPLGRESKADAARLTKDLKAIDRVLNMLADDAALVGRLRVERYSTEMAWRRAARGKEGNLSARTTRRRIALVEQFCRRIADARSVHVGHLACGASPSDASPTSGVTSLVISALRAVGYKTVKESTIFEDVRRLIAANRDEADADALRDADEMAEFADARELGDRPKFLAD